MCIEHFPTAFATISHNYIYIYICLYICIKKSVAVYVLFEIEFSSIKFITFLEILTKCKVAIFKFNAPSEI